MGYFFLFLYRFQLILKPFPYCFGWKTLLSGLTALHASSEEVSQWFDTSTSAGDGQNGVIQSQETSSSSRSANRPSLQNNTPVNRSSEKTKYTFICECFFMTARVLNLGLLKAFSDFKHLVQVIIPSLLFNWDIFCIKFCHCFLSNLFYNSKPTEQHKKIYFVSIFVTVFFPKLFYNNKLTEQHKKQRKT